MKKILPLILVVLLSLNAQALFEVKDASDHSVFEITDDGIRIFNYPDTLMIISSAEIRANLDNSTDKGLSRSFSVSTSATGKGTLANVLEISIDSTKIGTRATTMGSEGAGRYTDFSPDNIFIGLRAGEVSSGINNVFVGNNSGVSNTSGFYNVFAGFHAGLYNEGGNYNAFIGSHAGRANISSSNNTYIGAFSGTVATGTHNTFVGASSGLKTTTGSRNSFFGESAGNSNTTGYDNCFFGLFAGLCKGAGGNNTIMGSYAGYGVSTVSSYSDNCLFGSYTGYSISTGNNNTMIGSYSGKLNETGSGNVFIGKSAGYNELGSSKLYIDNTSTSTPLIYGDFTANALTINGTLGVTGNSTLSGTLDVTGNSTLSGTLSVTNNTTLNGTLGVTGNSTLSGTLGVTGNSTLGGTLSVTNNTTLNGTLTTSGTSTFNNDVGIGTATSSSYKLYIVDDFISIFGNTDTSTGTYTYGVYGDADGGSTRNISIYGGSATGTGVNWSGYFEGDINVTGTVAKSADQVKIDHPLDPTNKFLSHSTIISDQMTSMYHGNIVLDGGGKAVVTMPDWFEAMNTEFRYQLTAIGASAPGLYIATEISNESFEIAGGKSNMKVSWQITGIRNDNYAKKNRIEVETDKDSIERGYYLHPEAYGQPKEMGIDHQHEKLMKEQSSN